MIRTAIIDLDNCISNDEWRLCLIEPHHELPNDRYVKYHDVCHRDKPGNLDVLRKLQESVDETIIFTSRPEEVRTKTMEWLQQHSIKWAELFMRPAGNHMPSVELKRTMLFSSQQNAKEYGFTRELVIAIDDRHDILSMYRAEGIETTRRVQIYEQMVVHP